MKSPFLCECSWGKTPQASSLKGIQLLSFLKAGSARSRCSQAGSPGVFSLRPYQAASVYVYVMTDFSFKVSFMLDQGYSSDLI